MLLPFRYCGGRGSIPKQCEFSSPGLRSGASVWFPPYMHRYYRAEVFSVLSLVLSLILSPVRLFELGFSTHRLFKLGQTEYTNVLYRMQFSLLGLYLLQIGVFR